jgi:hypothetical protein
MPNTIHCPSCRRELRVPAELVDKKVKCPGCGVIFTAGLEPEAGAETPIVLEEELPAEPAPPQAIPSAQREKQPYKAEPPQEYIAQPQEYFDRRPIDRRSWREPGLAALRPPAICLLVSSLIGLLGTGYLFLNALLVTPEMLKQQMPPARTPEEQKAQEIVVPLFVSPEARIVHFVSIFVNLVIILSSIMMLFGKLRWLAFLGSVLAILNFDCCCCLPGIGFGIWSLLALNKPEVEAIFK